MCTSADPLSLRDQSGAIMSRWSLDLVVMASLCFPSFVFHLLSLSGTLNQFEKLTLKVQFVPMLFLFSITFSFLMIK